MSTGPTDRFLLFEAATTLSVTDLAGASSPGSCNDIPGSVSKLVPGCLFFSASSDLLLLLESSKEVALEKVLFTAVGQNSCASSKANSVLLRKHGATLSFAATVNAFGERQGFCHPIQAGPAQLPQEACSKHVRHSLFIAPSICNLHLFSLVANVNQCVINEC